MGLYPNIPHQADLKALKEAVEKRDIKKISKEDLMKMAEFVLNNNIFEFNSKAYHFVWTHGEQELETFLKHLNSFTPI